MGGQKLSYTQWMQKYCRELTCQQYNGYAQNSIPYSQLQKAWRRNGRWHYQKQNYVCGLHALNMAWCMLGYPTARQWKLSEYPCKYFLGWGWGLCQAQFAKSLIQPYFNSYSWQQVTLYQLIQFETQITQEMS